MFPNALEFKLCNSSFSEILVKDIYILLALIMSISWQRQVFKSLFMLRKKCFRLAGPYYDWALKFRLISVSETEIHSI